MKLTIYGLIFTSFVLSPSIQADTTTPFEINYSKLKFDDPLQLYANIRTIYGEGIESKSEGRTHGNNEQLKLGIRYKRYLRYDWFFKGDIRGVFLHRQDKNNVNTDEIWDGHFEVRELFLENKHLFNNLPIGLLAGRKQFRDDRAWWYSNQLDVAQLQYNSTLLKADISYGGRLIDERVITETQNIGFENSEFLISHLDYQFYYQHHFQTFAIYQNDDFSNNQIGNSLIKDSSLKSELNLLWIGFRFNGLFSLADRSKLNYWMDFATVNGSEREFVTTRISPAQKTITGIRNIDVSTGYGLDLGMAWKAADNDWGVTFNYAFGSGDSSASSRQASYRQPTISNNKGRVLGENRYRIYGELLRPELSNLQLFSLSAGRRLNEYLWLQSIYFHYWQVQADTELKASNLSFSPNGKNKDIGSEIDLILVGSWTESINIQFTLSGFHAGSAFDNVADSRYAYKGVLQFKLKW